MQDYRVAAVESLNDAHVRLMDYPGGANVVMHSDDSQAEVVLDAAGLAELARWSLARLAEVNPPIGHADLPRKLRKAAAGLRLAGEVAAPAALLLHAAARLERLDLEPALVEDERAVEQEHRPEQVAERMAYVQTHGRLTPEEVEEVRSATIPLHDWIAKRIDLAMRTVLWVIPAVNDMREFLHGRDGVVPVAAERVGTIVRCGPAHATWRVLEVREPSAAETFGADVRIVRLEPVLPHEALLEPVPELPMPVGQVEDRP